MSYFSKAILLTTKNDHAFLMKKCAHIEKSLGLPAGFVEVFKNDPDQEDSKRGCFNAHYDVYCYIAENELDNCLIFEDDVYFLKKVRSESYDGFLTDQDWDVFYFGHKPDFRQDTFARRTEFPGILHVRTNDRHAYAMNYKFARKMAEKPWSGVFGDRLLRSSTNKAYALVPGRAIQTGPLGSASYQNGITEKFNEYLRLAWQQPFQLTDFFRYSFLLIFKMPYWVTYFTFLALKQQKDQSG
ncbi:MAG: hypothetical protein CMP48_07700 [Rickettsiales bacterium]|nr:hypothetical protein [Rickettsiales bacterium]